MNSSVLSSSVQLKFEAQGQFKAQDKYLKSPKTENCEKIMNYRLVHNPIYHAKW